MADSCRMRLVVLLLFAMLLPAVGAESSPAPDNATFYGNVDCGGEGYWLSTVQDSVGTNCGTSAAGTSMEWVIPETRAEDSVLSLEEGGDVPMTVWIGSNTHAGAVDVTSTITAGDTVVATATASVEFVGAAFSYEEVTMTGTVQAAEVAGPLTWTVEADGAYSSIYMRFEEGRWSQFTLPILSVTGGAADAPAIGYENLSAAPELALSFDEAVNQSLVYNWTHDAPDGVLAYNFTGNGTVHAVLTDGNATTLLNETLDGAGEVPFTAGAVGDWSLRLDLAAVQGNLSVAVQPPSLDDTPASDGNSTVGPDGGNENLGGNATLDGGDDEESPGLPALLALGIMVALAVARRRR